MNFQNIPRKEKVIKRAIVPKLDYLLFADYAQIEMRILAYYMARMGDYSMARVLGDPNVDLHNESATGIFMLDRAPSDPERQLGKNMNFSMVYGAGTPAVMRYLLEFKQESEQDIPVTYKYAKEVLKRFHARWPGIAPFKEALHNTYVSRGDVKTIAGFPLHPPSQHQELSEIVQSSAAEETRKALIRCFAELREMNSHLVSVVHDELIFDVDKTELDRLAEGIPGWMDAYPEVSTVVPITVDLAISESNWADKHALS